MDRSWILSSDRLCREYKEGIASFIRVARNQLNDDNECLCPCRNCVNRSLQSLETIEAHIVRYGFQLSYDVWVCHGEREKTPSTFLTGSFSGAREVVNEPITITEQMEEHVDVLGPLFDDLGYGAAVNEGSEQPFVGTKFKLFGSTDKLYPGCKFTTLEAVIRLMKIKVDYRWSDKSFEMVLQFIKLMWPDLKDFPTSIYDARKRLRDVGLGYNNIDACKNDCSLFWKDHANDERCHVCNASRYKVNDGRGKKIPHKSLRYFPLIPRLQRLFISRHTAKDMRWHKEKRDDSSNTLIHPADGEAWQHFDQTYPDFADDPRNVRLGLAADGFSPFSASYSMWPVIVVPYNLPPWRCMQKQFRFLSLLIPGPTSPGKEIDVYLSPLIEELKELWNLGVNTYDAASHSVFKMKATLLWTINDFPAYGNLSGWSTHGKMACPVCMEDTTSESITHKICFMGARRNLNETHSWRRSRLHDGKFELRPAPKIKTGEDILYELERLPNIIFGKHKNNTDNKRKRAGYELNWTKKSIFFELPYWRHLLIRHMLDVMHIEKNICDAILYTLLNTEGRSKDTNKARIDLEKMKIRPNLHLVKLRNGKVAKPAAPYVFKPGDRTLFLEFLSAVKFPDGYAASLSRGINAREGKIHGLKSHDSHVIFQRLLPIGIRSFLPKDLCTTLIDFSLFFQQLTSKSLRKSDLDSLQELVVMVLCRLERIMPPAFFDVMIHLVVHLVREARLAGPVGPRWMYPIERDMGTYKGYVRNRAHPEGSIAEAYSIKEAVTFCDLYFDESQPQFTRPERNDDTINTLGTISVFSQRAKPFGGATPHKLSRSGLKQIHWAILKNCDELTDFVSEHLAELELTNPEYDIHAKHQEEFPEWFKQRMKSLRMEGSPLATKELFALSQEPFEDIHFYPSCIVNGVRFRTRQFDDRRKTQNSGVAVLGEHGEDEIDYYGYLTKVIVVDFILDYKVVLFDCVWYDTDPRKKNIKIDYHFKSINTKDKWFQDDPYILAIQAKQIFYLKDPKLGEGWQIIQNVEQRQIWNVSEKEDRGENAETQPDAYQQNESVRIEISGVDPDVDLQPSNEDLHTGEIELIDMYEQDLERLRQSTTQGANDDSNDEETEDEDSNDEETEDDIEIDLN